MIENTEYLEDSFMGTQEEEKNNSEIHETNIND